MKTLMFLLVASAFAMLELHAAPPAENQKTEAKKPAAKKAPPNKNQILARLRKETPFVQAKTGETVSCLLLSDVTFTGKIYRIQPDAVWIDDGTVKVKQKRSLLSMETRAKFWREDYNLYLNEQAEKEMLQNSLSNAQGNTSHVANTKDPRFKRPKMNQGNKLKKKK